MPVLESWVEKNVNTELRKWRILYVKMKPLENGFPDRLYILPNGLHVWIEFKRPVKPGTKRNEPEKLQIYRMKQLHNRNAIVGWTDDERVAIDTCKALLAASRLSKTSHNSPLRARVWGAIARSRIREDFDLFSYLQSLKENGVRPEDADSCTLATHDGDMVG